MFTEGHSSVCNFVCSFYRCKCTAMNKMCVHLSEQCVLVQSKKSWRKQTIFSFKYSGMFTLEMDHLGETQDEKVLSRW